MVKRVLVAEVWQCSVCGEIFLAKERAELCEQHHVEDELAELKRDWDRELS